MRGARPIVLGLAAALFCAGASVQYLERDASSVDASPDDVPTVASISLNGSTGSVWFCPLVASTEDNAQASLRISRPAGPPQTEPARLRVTLYGPAGQIVATPIQLAAGTIAVSATELLKSANAATLPSLAATVESDDPAIVVESSLGDRSSGYMSCTTGVSSRWFVPVGSTALQNDTELALFNPFPGTALVDLQFWSERGAARPTALQGVAVPGNGLRIIELGDFVRRRQHLATEVSVRTGRVIAATNHRVRGRSELSVAVPSLATQWFVPAAQWSEKRPEAFTFLNPNDTDSTVELSATLSPNDVEPFEVLVPANSSVVFDPSTEGRIPADSPYALVAQVSSGPAVALSRTVSPTDGKSLRFSQTASPVTAQSWLAAVGDAESVTVFNPYDVSVKVSSTLGDVEQKDFTLAPGAFRSLPITEAQRNMGSMSVVSDGAAVVVSTHHAGGADVVGIQLIDR
jgi:hypothetical protein